MTPSGWAVERVAAAAAIIYLLILSLVAQWTRGHRDGVCFPAEVK